MGESDSLTYNCLVNKFIKHKKEGRKCKFYNCPTILSMYNPTEYCYIHQVKGLEEKERLQNVKRYNTNFKRRRKYSAKNTPNTASTA